MKILTVMTTFALLVLSVVASEPERSVLISFPDETDSSIVEQAKQEIEAAGGIITAELNLIKGFAAKVHDSAIKAAEAAGALYHATIEDDQIITIADSKT